jgi:riboflavin kinase/FMN adenylyltransferase
MPAVVRDGGIVSSSAIRSALERGDVAAANGLLGYRWFVRAEVRHGDKRGRTLGYPTANLALSAGTALRHGIYAVRARVDGRVHDGVASFGRRPTFDNGAPLLEVFLFAFSGDLYGRTLDVELVEWIRGEERFESAEALVAQMDRDSAAAKAVLASDRAPSLLA